jgi:hypothetical protein
MMPALRRNPEPSDPRGDEPYEEEDQEIGVSQVWIEHARETGAQNNKQAKGRHQMEQAQRARSVPRSDQAGRAGAVTVSWLPVHYPNCGW